MIKGSKDLFITYQHMHTQLVKQCSVPSYVLQMQKILIFLLQYTKQFTTKHTLLAVHFTTWYVMFPLLAAPVYRNMKTQTFIDDGYL